MLSCIRAKRALTCGSLQSRRQYTKERSDCLQGYYLCSMRYITLLLLLLAFAACKNESPADTKSADRMIAKAEEPVTVPEMTPEQAVKLGPDDRSYVPGQRIGMITATTTPEQLTEYYGVENVAKDSISLGEGFFIDGYKVFSGTASEIALIFPGGEENIKVLQATIDLESTEWKSAQNMVGIGTTMDELVRYNGVPFNFMGFDWDYGGVVTDWQDGSLKDHRIRLGYDFSQRENTQLNKTLIGDQPVVSNSPYVKDVDIKVIQVIVRME